MTARRLTSIATAVQTLFPKASYKPRSSDTTGRRRRRQYVSAISTKSIDAANNSVPRHCGEASQYRYIATPQSFGPLVHWAKSRLCKSIATTSRRTRARRRVSLDGASTTVGSAPRLRTTLANAWAARTCSRVSRMNDVASSQSTIHSAGARSKVGIASGAGDPISAVA